jgi:HB1, ASXL, restriction endonuclease HTH domain
MEPRGATGGNQWQTRAARNGRKQAKSVATGCDRLLETFHGKEGSTARVRQRALQKPRTAGLFRCRRIALLAVCSGVESRVEEPVLREPAQRSGRRVIELWSSRREKWASGGATPWPRHRKGASDAKEAYARRVSEAGRDRRASYGAQALHTKEIAKRVIESGRCSGLKGKTPEATIAATLAVGSKPGGPFQRVDKGTYGLSGPQPKPAATKRPAPKRSPPATTNRRREPAKTAKTTDNVA